MGFLYYVQKDKVLLKHPDNSMLSIIYSYRLMKTN